MPSNAFARISAAIRRPSGFDPADLSGSALISGGVSGTLTSVSVPSGQAQYTSPGTYSWVAPTGVTSVCVVCIGGGAGSMFVQYSSSPTTVRQTYGGTGGDLVYSNNVAVTPGATYTVAVGSGGATYTGTSPNFNAIAGGDSRFGSTLVRAKGGYSSSTSIGGTVRVGGSGGYFGAGSDASVNGAGGGGAGGYSGNGGNAPSTATSGSAGSGGGGGGGAAGAVGSRGGNGGGTGILGEGSNGAGGTYAGGSGGAGSGGSAQSYGGGGAAGQSSRSQGGSGAVRIIWGLDRAFPSANTADV